MKGHKNIMNSSTKIVEIFDQSGKFCTKLMYSHNIGNKTAHYFQPESFLSG